MEVLYRGAGSEDVFFPHHGASQLAEQEFRAGLLERTDTAMPLLASELAVAHAPYTNRHTACVLETSAGLYGGHVYEGDDGTSISAEAMALAGIRDASEMITAVFVTATGVQKAKHAMPTPEAYDLLAPRLDSQAPLVLIGPNGLDECRVISPTAHHNAYAPKSYSRFDGTLAQVAEEAHWDTALDWEDATFMGALHVTGIRDGIQYFLTGSGSGRGASSNLVKPGYADLDIIAVSSHDRPYVEASFEGVADVWYGKEDITKEPHDVRLWPSGEVRPGTHYRGVCFERETPVGIDFFVARSLEQAIVRPAYLERNFFHEL